MSKYKKTDIKTMEEWLESDDELPDSYNERTETPTYMDDDRFNKIRFSWIFDKKLQVQCEKSDVPNKKSDLPNEKSVVPNEKSDVPKEKSDVPKEKSDVPNEKSDVPNKNATKADEGKIETREELCEPRKLFDVMPRKGILKRKDIYCLQSVENHLSDNTLLWFAKFMILKDLQSRRKSPGACLVYENVCDFNQQKHKPKDTRIDGDSNEKNKYKIVVKK